MQLQVDMENDNGGKVPVSSQIQENDSGTKYTIPGILHFIQHEWARFEMDRAHWDVEKAELQVSLEKVFYCCFVAFKCDIRPSNHLLVAFLFSWYRCLQDKRLFEKFGSA